MKKNLIVYQDNNKDCGSACLLSLIRYFGGDIPLNDLVELTHTNKNGTTFYELAETAYSLGLISKGFDVNNLEELAKLDKPFIAQVKINNLLHFVVVYKVKNNKYVIMDPGKGKVTLNETKFKNIFLGKILVLEPYKKLVVHKSDNYLKNVLIELFLANKKLVRNLFILSIIFTILTCIYSFYFKLILDNPIFFDNLEIITLCFLLILLIKLFANYFRNYLLIYLNQKIDFSIFSETYNKILSLPYNYYKTKSTGEVISRVNDLGQLKNLVSKVMLTIFLDALLLLFGGIVLLMISKLLFLCLIIIVIIYVFIFYIFRPYIKKMTRISQEQTAKVNSLLVESISGFESIKGLNVSKIFMRKMEDLYLDALESTVTLDKISNTEALIKDLTTEIGLLFVTFIGCTFILNGSLTIGSLITFNSLLTYFIGPIRGVIDTSKEYYFVSSSIKRANNLLNIEGEKVDNSNLLIPTGDIIINNLSFSYSSSSILKNVNLKIKEGNKILIMGKSGSGKSTLLKLLYSYYKVGRGTIMINDIDINDYALSDIRDNIGYISQNETLYTDTVKNNVILDRDCSYDDFLKVCKRTYVDEIVSSSPLGFDTFLEENGINISGGQRQRIVLARMLLKKWQILLIDEGLSQLDVNLERKVLKNLFRDYNDKTIIVVSHRNDNIDLYDKVVYLKDGIVTETEKRSSFYEKRNNVI